jgi:TolB-like protein/Flp pilus assembly protein TadD
VADERLANQSKWRRLVPDVANLLAEFKRRNVIRAALAYLAAAWLIAQAVGVVGDLITLPAWVGPAVLIVLAVGFVVVVILAWMYELTGHGFKTEAEVRADPSLVRVPARYLEYLTIGLLTTALGYFIWESRFDSEAGTADETISVAVLPFADLSPGSDQAWFSNGMADELMNALIRISELRVAGRRSVLSFDPASQSLAEFARSVGVSHVLEGTVRTANNRIRVSAQLVRAADGFNVWSQVFDEELTDIFAIQDRISEGVMNGLRLHIRGSDQFLPAAVSERGTDFASYEAYLQGRYYLSRRTGPDLEKAIDYFEESLRIEPDRSKTHSGIASVYAFMPYYSQVRSLEEIGALARSHATTAVRLDPSNAEAHSILGLIHMTAYRDWAKAASALALAYQYAPGDADIVNVYGDYFYAVGDYASAEEMEGTAAGLEPLSAIHQLELGLVYAFRGQYGKAIQQAELAIKLNGDLQNAWWQLSRSYIYSGDLPSASRVLHGNEAELGARYAARVRALLAAKEGDLEVPQSIAADEERAFLETGGSPAIVAFLFALAGDDVNAAAYVERAFDSNDAILISPMYFFLPEDWHNLSKLQEALNKPGLRELYDLRRRHVAAGTGRVLDSALANPTG